MEYEISNRLSGVHGSMIRELFKLGASKDIISFGGGNPSAETFPCREIEEIAAKGLGENPVSLLQYGLSEGYTPLRDTMKKYLEKKEGFDFENNELFIVSGGQQCADLTTKALVNEGDVVLTEEPAFVGCLNTFRSYGAKLVGIPMEQDGMNINALEEALKANPDAKLLYTIPSFQNPTGKTWSLERRRKLAELSAKYSVAVIEDNPYGELRFEGEPLPSIKSFDEAGNILCTGSFSKIFCPGFRIGWIAGDKEIIRKYVLVKQGTDLQCNTIAQMTIAEYLKRYDIDKHIAKIVEVYRKRRNVAIESIERYFPDTIKFTRPEGGLFTWIELPEGISARDVLVRSLEKKIAFVPGGSFYPDGNKENTLRINYSNMPEDKIEKGLKTLGEVVKEYISQSK